VLKIVFNQYRYRYMFLVEAYCSLSPHTGTRKEHFSCYTVPGRIFLTMLKIETASSTNVLHQYRYLPVPVPVPTVYRYRYFLRSESISVLQIRIRMAPDPLLVTDFNLDWIWS